MIQMLIDFIMKLFGLKKDEPASLPSASGTASAPSTTARTASSDDADTDDEADPPAANDFGPLGDNLDEFTWHEFQLERASEDDAKFEALMTKLGYRDKGHFDVVKDTFYRKYGSMPGQNGSYDRYTEARLRVGQRYQQEQMQQAVSADPNLLAPVEGVSVETFAQISAAQAKGVSGQSFVDLLTKNGMDAGKWGRVSTEWNSRMSKDTSFTITQIYSKAFAGAGQGSYGAAGQAGSAAMMGLGGQAGTPQGPEPVSLEKYAEIMGAQGAWSQQGKDVNAMLKQVFGLSALDYSNISSYWSTRMMTEYDLAMKLGDLQQKYTDKYLKQGGGKADADLTF